MKITLEDEYTKVSIEDKRNTHSLEDAVRLLANGLQALTFSPQGICNEFMEYAEQHSENK